MAGQDASPAKVRGGETVAEKVQPTQSGAGRTLPATVVFATNFAAGYSTSEFFQDANTFCI